MSILSESTNESPACGLPEWATGRESESAIVFFDGECALCHGTVRWLLKRDRHGCLRFAPLQGKTADHLLPEKDRAGLGSMVYFERGRLFRRSGAVVRSLWKLGGIWRLAAAALWLIPLPLRDLGYRCVAEMRYRLFGRVEACSVADEAERRRLLP